MSKRFGFSLFFLAVVAVVMYASGGLVIGSGNIVEELRQIGGFDKVVFSGSDVLVVKQGASFSLNIIADEKIIERVRTDVINGTLHIDRRNISFWPLFLFTDTIRYELTMPSVTGLELKGSGVLEATLAPGERLEISLGGSGVITIDGIDHQLLAASLNGSGVIKLTGAVEQQQFSLNGSGNYFAKELRADIVDAHLNGSGNALVWAISSLDIELNGSGNLSYYDVPEVSQRVSGSGNINALGPHE
jgi:hypothetical protein